KNNPFINLSVQPDFFFNIFTRYTITRAKRRIVCVMSALERKKLAEGHYPVSSKPYDKVNYALLGLDKSICQDPFMTDTPLLYFSDGTTYNVWSVGPDLHNADAKIIYDPTNGISSSGDIAYR
ncbi:hypothetical protein J7M23_06520, partial [Candidatus Sumerlaeota bacterium]|nr:hypothetical protein [Candidatus Sumerlaeota bacterium]